MNYSKTGLALTERFEGLRLTAYRDSTGKLTIGYGHTAGVTDGMTCTQEQANFWLEDDIRWAEAFVNAYVGVQLTQGEFDALVDFTFNLGVGSLKGSTLLKLVNEGKFKEAALEFEKWDHAGGIEVAGLLHRRIAEKQEFKG